MPTRAGAAFLTVLVVMILTASTYNNNLIYILAFFLFGVFVVSMLQTHYNIKGVRLKVLSASDAFQGEPSQILFQLEQSRARIKKALVILSRDKKWPTLNPQRQTLTPRDMRQTVRGQILAGTRGQHRLPSFLVETRYPLGLFRAWKVFRTNVELTVYPRPVGVRTLEIARSQEGEHELGLRSSPEGDFGELKTYRAGESYHQIAWKQFAKRGDLYTRVHWGEDHKHYHIPWDPAGQEFEAYLSQMSAWVQLAMSEGATFHMDLPLVQIGSGSGFEHGQKCWRALAQMKERA